MKFSELPLNEKIRKGLDEAGFIYCTPVQEKTLEKTLKGTDVQVQSQTGTGKTGAFLITIFHLFMESDRFQSKKALIVVPTRELAVQVENDAKLLGKYCHMKVGSFYGGVGYTKQELMLKDNLNIYIGTPGRLIDFYRSRKIDFKKMDVVVIDEADRLFDMGFYPDIRYMLQNMVPPSERVTMIFSATLSMSVKELAYEFMKDPEEVLIESENITVKEITQELYHVGKKDKFGLLLGLLRREKPQSALIFTNTKREAEFVSRKLAANGFRNDYISGDIPQKKRLKIIESIKSGKQEFLVATDVAARGLHIEALDIVFNYDLPGDCESYVHRIGRTARAGKSGKAISLACEEYVYNLDAIEKFIKMKIPVGLTEDSLIVKNVARFQASDSEEQSEGRRGRDRDRRPRRDRSEREKTSREPRKKSRSEEAVSAVAEKPSLTDAESTQKKKRKRKRRGKSPEKEITAGTSVAAASQNPKRAEKGAKTDDRLDYYKKKYGENFVYKEKDSSPRADTPKKGAREDKGKLKGFFKNIVSRFKK